MKNLQKAIVASSLLVISLLTLPSFACKCTGDDSPCKCGPSCVCHEKAK
ncbi:MAG: hypothetical protein SFU25_04905 [Candidatus Caenarcaniphilales bacterium]|nr:hypothetical protein [Candidatus Caenarcaniphilales bacterium]